MTKFIAVLTLTFVYSASASVTTSATQSETTLEYYSYAPETAEFILCEANARRVLGSGPYFKPDLECLRVAAQSSTGLVPLSLRGVEKKWGVYAVIATLFGAGAYDSLAHVHTHHSLVAGCTAGVIAAINAVGATSPLWLRFLEKHNIKRARADQAALDWAMTGEPDLKDARQFNKMVRQLEGALNRVDSGTYLCAQELER